MEINPKDIIEQLIRISEESVSTLSKVSSLLESIKEKSEKIDTRIDRVDQDLKTRPCILQSTPLEVFQSDIKHNLDGIEKEQISLIGEIGKVISQVYDTEEVIKTTIKDLKDTVVPFIERDKKIEFWLKFSVGFVSILTAVIGTVGTIVVIAMRR
jgi:hypothetical protein